jgi:hypothetical protein
METWRHPAGGSNPAKGTLNPTSAVGRGLEGRTHSLDQAAQAARTGSGTPREVRDGA